MLRRYFEDVDLLLRHIPIIFKNFLGASFILFTKRRFQGNLNNIITPVILSSC